MENKKKECEGLQIKNLSEKRVNLENQHFYWKNKQGRKPDE